MQVTVRQAAAGDAQFALKTDRQWIMVGIKDVTTVVFSGLPMQFQGTPGRYSHSEVAMEASVGP